MKEYTHEMRIRNQPCPYCGFWHSAMSHPPQFSGYILEILELEQKIEDIKNGNIKQDIFVLESLQALVDRKGENVDWDSMNDLISGTIKRNMRLLSE